MHGTPEEILGSFDFTINQFCLHGDNLITYSNYALGDLIARRLRLVDNFKITNNSLFKNRLKKFLDNGFILDSSLYEHFGINI